MTTYGPNPEVPTAAVPPADDCVIAPPLIATSTVFRKPNCPTIRWDASRCREPSALAFAVTWTLGVDARRVGGVTGASFHGHAGRAMHTVADDFGVDANQWLFQGWAALANNGRFNSVDWRRATCGHPQVSNSEPLEGVRLGATEWPRICSERGITHGFEGGRRCLPAWFRCRPPRPLSGRRCRCMERPQTSTTTPTRSTTGDWAGRGHGFAAGRPSSFPAPAHLQCKFLFLEYL